MRRQVLVTGASSGLGSALVSALFEADFGVWATVRSDQDRASLRRRHGPRVRTLELDLRNPESVTRAADRILAQGPLHSIVHNAGAAFPAPVELAEPESVDELLTTNVIGPLRLTQRLLPALREGRRVHGDAKIIFVGSLITRVPLPMFGPYCITKHALVGLTDALRAELAEERIRVCLLEPGVFATRIWLRADDQARRLSQVCSPDSPYAGLIDATNSLALVAYRFGSAPERAAAAVVRCLRRSRPAPRRTVPGHARLIAAAAAVVPARLAYAAAAMIASERGTAVIRRVSARLLRLRQPGGIDILRQSRA